MWLNSVVPHSFSKPWQFVLDACSRIFRGLVNAVAMVVCTAAATVRLDEVTVRIARRIQPYYLTGLHGVLSGGVVLQDAEQLVGPKFRRRLTGLHGVLSGGVVLQDAEQLVGPKFRRRSCALSAKRRSSIQSVIHVIIWSCAKHALEE